MFSFACDAVAHTFVVPAASRKSKSRVIRKQMGIECEEGKSEEDKDGVNHTDLLNDTENLISKNKEMLERMMIQLQISKQPYLDHKYAVFNRMYVAVSVSVSAVLNRVCNQPSLILSMFQ